MFQVNILKNFLPDDITPGNILLIGPPGIGKTNFSETVLYESVNSDIKILYITIDHDPTNIRNRVCTRYEGFDKYFNDNNIIFVDGYSWLIGVSPTKYAVRNLSNLSDLSVKILGASHEMGQGIIILFDSISSLLIYNSENEVERFLNINMARIKKLGNLGFWILEDGIHTTSFYNTLRYKVDGILEMRFNEGNELTRSVRMHTYKGSKHDSSWKTFLIVDGIAVFNDGKREKDLYLSPYMKNS